MSSVMISRVAHAALCFAAAAFASYLAATPQVLHGAGARILGGNNGCALVAATCGGPPGSACAAQARDSCTLANNSDYCCETNACGNCPQVDNTCKYWWFSC